jgi:2,4-dienoyl-CoA reductase-like NADH-dependent reductase (Old Yellow Enzyme family)
MNYTRLAQIRTINEFRTYCQKVGADLACDENVVSGAQSPLGQPIDTPVRRVGNRFAILPMEGWDGTEDGLPSELTIRRWQHFGESGAKLIWGGEAVAIRHDGRANPNQLLANEHTLAGLAQLRQTVNNAHIAKFGTADDLVIGLQLTHSGRWSKPNDKKRMEPLTAHNNALLDKRYRVPDGSMLSDDALDRIIEDFGKAAIIADKAGYDFVDLKHCHGYLGHELLSAHHRPGKYGGSFENRTRFLREGVAAIRANAPRLKIGVRLSAIDFLPYKPGENRIGVPDDWQAVTESSKYEDAFGGDGTGIGINYDEPNKFLALMKSLDIRMLCVTLGSPYYNPHIIRPAYFPPSDGYLPPEDPLVGVARHIQITAELKRLHPDMIIIGSGYSYLQEWLPYVAQFSVRNQLTDMVGVGRLVLSYHDMPADILAGKTLQRKRICRTFSDCTTAPRNGLVSGCYPLDDHYKKHPHKALLDEVKQ